MIDVLHTADYAHGDLNLGNIGIHDNHPVILNPETMFLISTSHTDYHVLEYAINAFETNDIDWLINLDYDNWKEELEE